MYIHEYQAKKIFMQYGIPVPPFAIAANNQEVENAIIDMRLHQAVIKVQVHAGGRKKAGGVKFANNPEEIVRLSSDLIGMRIINDQTGPKGVVAQFVIISPSVSIKKEYYLSVMVDRSSALPILIASPKGGVDIEEIAKTTPQDILKIPFRFDGHIRKFHLFHLAKFMGWRGTLAQEGMKIALNLAKAFIETDASLIEINPFIETEEGKLLALDAKFTIDDNALFRQPAISQWYDPSQDTPNEVMAKDCDLSYIGLDGEIGCLVNGAGLAMATMDIIHYYGGKPANFLDVGGGASKEEIAHGFKIILLDPKVKSIFVNIFGGIMDCSVLAKGIVEAMKKIDRVLPLIIRIEGTNAVNGKQVFKESGLNLIMADTMEDGAIKVIKAAKSAD
ncbi:MAG: ADP-forming succinate--CoA ligase subunit beta [Chlamydiales bacterium]